MSGSADLFSVTGRVACVTGASQGLGQRAASVLAAYGAKVVGVARREDRLSEWSDKTKGETAFIASDIADHESLAKLVPAISAPFGPPDIIVNAAGMNPRKKADDVSAEIWDQTLALNLSAPFFMAQAFAGHMIAQNWGRIVNFASLQSSRAFPSGISYGATKGGIAQLTRAMAEEWGHANITANAIAPGFFPTELTEAVFADPERAKRNATQTCLGRNGAASDLDGTILFLCSEASAYITGQILHVDGGFTAK